MANGARLTIRSRGADPRSASLLADAHALGLEDVEENPRATDAVNLEAMAALIVALEKNGHT
ncbi:MAG: hypothetical protein WCK21_12210, partial [Actinomycetota bacterium]